MQKQILTVKLNEKEFKKAFHIVRTNDYMPQTYVYLYTDYYWDSEDDLEFPLELHIHANPMTAGRWDDPRIIVNIYYQGCQCFMSREEFIKDIQRELEEEFFDMETGGYPDVKIQLLGD